jgi:mannitol/fructose-specific phosphotransferase system IIA component (Ntr-type)
MKTGVSRTTGRQKTKFLLDMCARAAAEMALDPQVISIGILKREELGSTGVAIPHGRIPGRHKPLGILARLKTAGLCCNRWSAVMNARRRLRSNRMTTD